MQPLKWILTGALIAVWFGWDFGNACVRTFILGQTYEQQMAQAEESGV